MKVTLLDQSSYTAKVVGFDPDKDVAVLQLDAPPDKVAQLQPVTLGASGSLMVGQKVYAIGKSGTKHAKGERTGLMQHDSLQHDSLLNIRRHLPLLVPWVPLQEFIGKGI